MKSVRPAIKLSNFLINSFSMALFLKTLNELLLFSL